VTNTKSGNEEPELRDLDLPLGIPVSVRLPAKLALLLYLYAERMNTSAGKVLASLLEDTLPVFTDGENFGVTLRLPQVYQAMQRVNLLKSVDPEELKKRMVQRYEGTGPRGRPRKVREKPLEKKE
jgi:hypothetical protein